MMHPLGNILSQGFDVAGQGCIERFMGQRVVTNKINDWRAGAARIVQVSNTVAKSRTQVQQRYSRLAGYSSITVGRAGTHAFKKTEDSSKTRLRIHRLNKVHL